MSSLGLFTLLVTALVQCQGHWDNDFDQPLNFKCISDSWAVTSIVSVHSNHHEDRRFELGCTRVSFSTRRKRCYWTNYVNSMDELIHFACKSNHYINGMSSYHRNYEEDRLWKFRCCAIDARPLENCELSGWTNKWDERQHFVAPTGNVIKGVVSIHDNFKEDRLYEYLVCKVGGREEVRATTLLDYLMQKSQEESEDESREMTPGDYPEVESMTESEEDPREMALGDFSKEESLEKSEEDPWEMTIGDFSKEVSLEKSGEIPWKMILDDFLKDESDDDSRETNLRYSPE